MQVTSRVVGVHQLLLINFYPILQRYIQPHQRNVTIVLASLVQACHQGVPPDILQPVLRQLLDNFISDKSRPEVMTVGLNTVREMAFRCPLLLEKDVLSDLVDYKKYKDKGVSSAARGLVSLYREMAPHMLHKKDRGKGADLDARISEYGYARPATRVEGVTLLEEDELNNETDSDGDEDEEEEDAEWEDEEIGEEIEEEGSGNSSKDEQDFSMDSGDEGITNSMSCVDKVLQQPQPGSLRSLRRAAKMAAAEAASLDSAKAPILLEQTRFLTDEDFARIKMLRNEAAIGKISSRYGMRAVPASERKINPAKLEALKVKGHDKKSRLESVLKGREDRGQFGAAADRKKKKTGGLSNKEKAKKKTLPKGVLNKLARSRAKHKKKIGTKKTSRKLY